MWKKCLPCFKSSHSVTGNGATELEGNVVKYTISNTEAIEKELREQIDRIVREKDRIISDLKQDLRVQTTGLQNKVNEQAKEIEKYRGIIDSIQSQNVKKNRKQAITGKNVASKANLKVYQKDAKDKNFLKKAILQNEFLKRLKEEQIVQLIECMHRSQEAGEIIKEGENGDRLYILETGELEVTKNGETIRTLTAGTVFGELAILCDCERTATVTAKTPTKIWTLERSVYQAITIKTGNAKRNNLLKALRKVPLLQSISREKLGKLVDALEEETYQKNHYIVRQGEEGGTFFIILEGEVDITSKDDVTASEEGEEGGPPEECLRRTIRAGDFFGEKALSQDGGKRSANAIAKTSTVRCMTLEKQPFLELIGSLANKDWTANDRFNSIGSNELLTVKTPKTSAASAASRRATPDQRRFRQSFLKINRNELTTVKTLGIGGFGRVDLVKHQDKTYALKIMKKTHIIETDQQKHVFAEKETMMVADSQFIIKLFMTFKDSRFVYMLTEACLGGELWSKLREVNYFDSQSARFYVACVVEALDHLHSKGIMYRDMKPENLLLDGRGYIKVVDFGFAKSVSHGEKTWTFCGTPEYIAPEIILAQGHDKAVDYWALGILVFELLTGNPPFTSQNPMNVYRLALRGVGAIDWSFPNVRSTAQDLIRCLCRDKPTKRIGNMRLGVDEIRNHSWFRGFHWAGLKSGTLAAPHIPTISDNTDTRNFDNFDEGEIQADEEMSGWDDDF